MNFIKKYDTKSINASCAGSHKRLWKYCVLWLGIFIHLCYLVFFFIIFHFSGLFGAHINNRKYTELPKKIDIH